MEFLSLCLKELSRDEHGTVHKYGGKTYFSLECIKSLSKIVNKIGTISEIAITPFYFFGEQILELYDYSLSIRVVDSLQSREQFLLEETGKSSVHEIDLSVIEKLDNTYYEVFKEDSHTFLKSLEKYVGFMNERERYILLSVRDEANSNKEQEIGIFYELI